MTWKHHKMTAGAIVYVYSGSLTATGLALVGAVLPDMLEFRKLIQHRTYTHYIWFYLLAILLVGLQFRWAAASYAETGQASTLHLQYGMYALNYLLVGCVIHLLVDMMSKGGIPIKTPTGKPFGFHWYILGDAREAGIAWGITLASFALAGCRGLLDPSYLIAQSRTVVDLVLGVF